MKTSKLSLLLATSVTALAAHPATADIIDNGTVQLGVNPEGNLIDRGIGLTFLTTTAASGEALAPGCDCEGWGVSDLDTGEFGKAGEDFSDANIASSSLTVSGTGTDAASVGDSAVSVANVADGALSLELTHDFTPSVSENLYRVDVAIRNTGAGPVGDLVYRRAMDWDIPPTEFSELVTIGGWPASNLIGSSDDGFVDGNPNVALSTLAADAVLDGNFTDSGPADHGAAFDFGFGTLAVDDTQDFQIFYGAAASEADAFIALGDVGAEVFSFGQPSTPDGDTLGTPNTFIFGFSGVGGTPVGPGGGAATVPLNFASDLANLVVDHHIYRTAQRLDLLSRETSRKTLSTKGHNITPLGIEGITIRLAGSYFDGDFDTTTNNVGIDYDTRYLGVSVEREFDVAGPAFSRGMIGVSYGYENASASRKDNLGSFDLDGHSLAIYGGVANPKGFFVDGGVFYTDLDYDQERIGITQVFESSPNGDSWGTRLRGGYNFVIGGTSADETAEENGPRFSQKIGVYAEWTHRDTSINGYTENNNGLTISDFSDDSDEVGIGARYSFQGAGNSGNIFGNVDVAALTDLSGGDFSVTQTTVGGATLSRVVDGTDDATLRGSIEIGIADSSGWSGAARLGGRISDDHAEGEIGVEISRRF